MNARRKHVLVSKRHHGGTCRVTESHGDISHHGGTCVESQSHMATSRIRRRKLSSRVESHHITWRPIYRIRRRKLSSRVESHHMATDLSHQAAETVSSRGKDNKQHLDENRLTLTYNKRRSPFHLPTAERLGATGGEPTQKGPRGTERVGDRRGAHSSHQAWKKRYRRTQANGGKLSHQGRQKTVASRTAENCRIKDGGICVE